MTEALPLAFVTFKRCVVETLAGCTVPFRVERHGSDWLVSFTDPSGNNVLHIPPKKGMITSETAARDFARQALEMALEDFATDEPPREKPDA